MEKRISFPTDSDGFLSQECPACEGRFKALIGSGSTEPLSFCPYCSHHGQQCWWTPEQAEYINHSAQEMASEHIHSELAKMARSFNRKAGSGLIKMKMDVKRSRTGSPPQPVEVDVEMPIFEFTCCGERIKHDQSEQRLFCVICGKEHTL